jgi:hypothetical protein
MTETIESVQAAAAPVLLRLALVSHAPTARLGSIGSGSNSAHESHRPPGDSTPDAEYFRTRLDNAESLSDALEAYLQARACLAGILRRTMATVTGETAAELGERIVEDGEGWEAEDVALALRCTPTFVRKSRLSLGRDPETGYSAPDGDPMAVALELRERGRSLRTIARLTGIPRSTLHSRMT